MKTLHILRITLFLSFSSNILAQVASPNWLWTRGSTGGDVVEVADVTADKNGNTIVWGYLEGDSVTFGPYTIHSTSPYTTNFLVKYTSSGQVQWTFTIPGFANYNFSRVATDTSGNIFTFTSPINTPTIYFMKVSSNGSLLWIDSNAATHLTHANSGAGVATDLDGNVYFTGSFSDSLIVFGHDTLRSLTPSNGLYNTYFLVKYSAGGSELWAKTVKPKMTSTGGSAVATDTDNNLFVAGGFTGDSLTIGNVTLHTPYERYNGFVAKYDKDGTVLWAKSFSGLSASASAIHTDHQGNIYVLGKFTDSLFIDNSLVVQRPYANTNFYVAKLNSAGHVLWVTASYEMGTNPTHSLLPYSLTSNIDGNIYLSGGQFDMIYWHNDSIIYTPTSTSNNDKAFLLSLDSSGHIICAETFQYGGDDASGLTADPLGNLYWTGDYFASTFVIGADTLRGGGVENAFLAKFSPCGKINTSVKNIISTSSLGIYPNPNNGLVTASFIIPQDASESSLLVTDLLGQKIKSFPLQSSQNEFQFDTHGINSGIYLVSIIADGRVIGTKKMTLE